MAEQEPTQPEAQTSQIQQPNNPEQKNQKTGDLFDVMQGYLKAYNGYKYIAVSRIMSYDSKDPKKASLTVKKLAIRYVMMNPKGTTEDFQKIITTSPICYIQAFAEMPTMAEDGMYTAVSVNGEPIKCLNIKEFMLTDPDAFEPFILFRDPDDFNKVCFIKGDPYNKVTKEQVEAIREMFKKSELVDHQPS